MANSDDTCPRCNSVMIRLDDGWHRCTNTDCGFKFLDTGEGKVGTHLFDTPEEEVSKLHFKLGDAIIAFRKFLSHNEGIDLMLRVLTNIGNQNIEAMNEAYRRYASRPLDEQIGNYRRGSWRWRKYQLFKAGWMARCIYEERLNP